MEIWSTQSSVGLRFLCTLFLKMTEKELEQIIKTKTTEKKTKEIVEIVKQCNLLDLIEQIEPIKVGMTNQLLRLHCKDFDRLLRIPGAGSEKVVNRYQEAKVYEALAEDEIIEDIFYLNWENGVKISRFFQGVHNCNPREKEEVKCCIATLKEFHKKQYKVAHRFDVFAQIRHYEDQCGPYLDCFPDFNQLRSKIMGLKSLLSDPGEACLCHIDSVYDNFLIGEKQVYLIDWEYAAMADPRVDIAMFCIYASYSKEMTDWFVEEYFEQPTKEDYLIIYAYMAACAYLWVIWSEIKKSEGVSFEEYEEEQYRIAQEFYQYAYECYLTQD